MTATPLEGRVAIVTGAARNIGRAIALALAADGAAIVVNARNARDEAEATAEAIRVAGGHALVKLADVTQPDEVEGLVAAAVETFGGLDVLVNNAAVRRETPIAELSLEEWREVTGIILDGAFLMVKAAQPVLARSDQAAIVNIGGLSAHTGAAARAHVVAAKAGLVGLTRALAHEFAPGITVNCVVPGMIATKRERTSAGEPSHHARQAPLVGRRGTPEEVAALVRLLAGPDGRYLTGQTIHANGGVFMP